VGVDGLELGGRLPARERRARQVEKQGHFSIEIERVQADVEARYAYLVGVDEFEEGIEDSVLGGCRS
jgi:hypothetical protein